MASHKAARVGTQPDDCLCYIFRFAEATERRLGGEICNRLRQQQFDDLRARADRAALSPDEQHILDQLFAELEQQEWSVLRPALDALRRDQGQLQAELGHLQAQNAVLSALTARYADLVARARVQLAGLAGERESLRAEYERVRQS